MNDLQKFYADINRCIKEARFSGKNGKEIAACAADFFVSWNRGIESAARELSLYWLEKRVNGTSAAVNGPSAEDLDWLADAAALLSGELEADRDFSAEDWREIRDILNCEAEDMPLEQLSSIMSIMVERCRLD